MRVSELSFDSGNTSQTFKLADGHSYYLHRVQREDKPPVYALMGLDQMQTMSPYINEQAMDTVLAKRIGEDRKAIEVDPWVSGSGFVCPGCGAKVTKDGSHFPPEPEPVLPPSPELPKLETAQDDKPRSRFVR